MTYDRESALSELERLLERPEAPISKSSRATIQTAHIADSLAGLDFPALTSAATVADIGSGAGLPGLPLAISLPSVQWTLIDATGTKCAFIERAVVHLGLANVEVSAGRTEELASGPPYRERFDAVTARAVGPLTTTAELASPLLRDGGMLVIWRGAREPDVEEALERSADRLSMEQVAVEAVRPYPGSRDRHIHLLRKNGPTPDDLPRRPGMAAKRPFGIE